MSDDDRWMALALEEARKGVGRTAPNPPVGCVLVRDGELLGSGWHRGAGRPHAEREAIADAQGRGHREKLPGATAYVTLEPCSTHGRTPPCTDGLIKARVARVVYAVKDRNLLHCGAADVVLGRAGIEVESGLMEVEAMKLLRPFFKVQETGLPWVIWKSAMSLDGRITRPPGEPQWLSCEESRYDVQRLRSEVDGILTSGETVRRDKPALTIRVPEFSEGREQPWRVVFTDSPDSLPEDAPLLCDEWRERTLIRGRGGLEAALRKLVVEQRVLSVMVEAGGVFSAAMFEHGLVDEVVVYYAPMLCGGPAVALAGSGLPESLRLDEVDFTRIGDDVKLRALVRR